MLNFTAIFIFLYILYICVFSVQSSYPEGEGKRIPSWQRQRNTHLQWRACLFCPNNLPGTYRGDRTQCRASSLCTSFRFRLFSRSTSWIYIYLYIYSLKTFIIAYINIKNYIYIYIYVYIYMQEIITYKYTNIQNKY